MREEGGNRRTLCIRRFRCTKCSKYHNELPDCLVPRKHYKAETICGVIDGKVTEDDLDSEDYPCATTMKRWRDWYHKNKANIEGHLHRVKLMLTGYSVTDGETSLLKTIQDVNHKWLETILKSIYNSGGYLVPVY